MNSPLINSFDYIDSTQYPEACMAVATCTISHFCVVVPWFTKRRFLATEDFQLFMHSPTFHLCPRISVPPGITFKFIKEQILVNLPQLKNFTLHKTTAGFSGIADELLKIPTLESFEFNDNVFLSAADFVKMFDHGNRSVRQSAIAQLSFRCFNNGFQKMPDQNFGRQCYEAGVASRLKAYCERDANETNDTSKIFFRKMEGLLYAIKDLTFKDVEWFVDYIVWGLRPDVAGASKPSLTSDLNLLALINAIQICRENPSRARELAQHHPYFFREVYHHCFPLKFRRREVPPVPKREDYYDDQLYFAAVKNRKLAIHENAELTRLDGVRRIRAIQALYTLCGEFDATVVMENPTLLDEFDLEKLAINATNFDGDRRRESVEWCSSVIGSLLRARIHLSKENPFYLTRRNVDEDDEDEDVESTENDGNRNDTSNFTTLTSLSDAELKLRRQRAEDIARKRWFDIPKIPSRRKKTSSSAAVVTADGEEQEQAEEEEEGHDSVLGPNTARLLVDTMNDHDGNINTYKFITTLMDDIFMSAQHSSNATRRAGTGPRDPCDIRRRRYVNLVLPLERANFIPAVLRIQNRTNIGARDQLTPEGIERLTRELKVFTLGMASLSLTRLLWLHKYFDWPRSTVNSGGAGAGGTEDDDQKSPLMVVSVLDPDDLCFALAKSRGVQCSLNSAVTNTTTESVMADNFCPEVLEDLTTNPILVKKEEERRLARWLFFVKQFQVIPDAYERLKAMNKTAERMLNALANRNMCPDAKDYSDLVTTLFPKESRHFMKTAESARQKTEVQEICKKDDDACEMFVREAVRRGYAKQNGAATGPEGFRGFMDMLLGKTMKGNGVPHNTNEEEDDEEGADDEDENDSRSDDSPATTVLAHGSDEDDDNDDDEEVEEVEEDEEEEEEGNDNTNNNNNANANPLLRYMQGLLMGMTGLGDQQAAHAGEDEDEDEEGSDDDFEMPSIDEIMDGSYKKKLTATLQRKRKEEGAKGKGTKVYAATTTASSGPRRRTRDGDVVVDDEGNTAPKKKKTTTTTKKPTPKKPQPKAKKPSPKRMPAAKNVTKKAAATKKKASKKSTSTTKKAVSTKKKPVAKKSSTSKTKAAKPSAKKTSTKGKKGKK